MVITKELLFRYVLKIGKQLNSQAVKAGAFHHRSDAITSIAAFIGISIALIGGKGYEGADDWAALFACCFIMYNAIQIIRPAVGEIMDKAPEIDIINNVRFLAQKVNGVKGIEKCYIRKMGLEYYVDLHLEVDGDLSVNEGHQIAHRVKDLIINENPYIRNVLIHVEPFRQHSIK